MASGSQRFFSILLIAAFLMGVRLSVVNSQETGETVTNKEYLLFMAAIDDDTAVIRALVIEKVVINARSDYGATPLLLAAVYNMQTAALLLLEMGADPRIPDIYGQTPLHAAIKNQNIPVAESLIKAGAGINEIDDNGATPLHYAALHGFFYEADMLLYYGADINIKAKDGTTPLMAAVMSGYYDIADILIREGADVNAVDRIGYTPLLIAAQNGDTLSLDLLLLSGAQLYVHGNDRFNAAGVAIRDNHPEALRYLLKSGGLWSSQQAANMWLIAEKYQRRAIIPVLKEFGIEKPKGEGFDEVLGGVSLFSTSHQSMLGLSLKLKKRLPGAGLVAGIDLKPWDSRIIIRKNQITFNQYIDRRSVVWAGFFKDFRINGTQGPFEWHFSTTVKAGWKFGDKYPGTEIKPEHGLVIIPGISLIAESSFVSLSASVEYMRTEVYKSGPVWLRLGLAYNYRADDLKSSGKYIRWR
jgi:ankyrin repeat protein